MKRDKPEVGVDRVEGAPGTPVLEIHLGTSPELAIKVAYDFARKLRMEGASERDFDNLLTNWAGPFDGTPLALYVRSGFTAGYHFLSLPWRRQIDDVPGGGTPKS